jgi:short-subunit dehydrogenase
VSPNPKGRIHALAIVTGASVGIGYELAQSSAPRTATTLFIAATRQERGRRGRAGRGFGVAVEAVETDLATT